MFDQSVELSYGEKPGDKKLKSFKEKPSKQEHFYQWRQITKVRKRQGKRQGQEQQKGAQHFNRIDIHKEINIEQIFKVNVNKNIESNEVNTRRKEKARHGVKRLGGGQPPSFPWHARPQSHEIQYFLSNLGFFKEFCDPCLGHDTIWRPRQEMKVYVDNINM